jgi:hypothetical protein
MLRKESLKNACTGTSSTSAAHLAKYRENNLAQVRRLEFNPTGVSPETGAIAKALGSCIVDSPDLRATLVSILAPRDRQQISERLDTAEALVVEAVLALSRGGAEQLYAREIAVEVNRLVEARGERSIYFRRLSLKPSKMSAFHLMESWLSPYA